MASYTHFSSASSTLLSPSSAPASSSSSPPPLLRLRLLLGIKRWYGDWRSTFPNSEPLSASAFCFPGIFWAAIRRVGSWNSRDIRSCIQYKSPAAQQSLHATNQPWLSCSAQGKQPLAPPSYRPLVNKTSMQPISHVPQQHLSTSPATSQPQQQHQSEGQLQQKPLPHPHQPARVQGPVSQKGTSPAMLTQPPVSQPGNQAKTVSSENEVSDNRILGKRNIHELLQQIDPSEKLDPEVEAILADIAEDFVESITTFGCSLAKHRKSDTLRTSCSMLKETGISGLLVLAVTRSRHFESH